MGLLGIGVSGCVRAVPPGEFKVQIFHPPECVAVEPKAYDRASLLDYGETGVVSQYRLDRGERTLRFDCAGKRVEQRIVVESDMGRSLDAAAPPWKP